jgi:peptidoglycan/xylan/chitin deacetylase (PgdA/CDA1 family)
MRLDRLLTLYFFGPLSRLRRLPPGTVRIPILMYHSISDTPETGHPYYWINTKPALFAEHMRFLYENSYQVIPLSTAVKIIRAGNPKSQFLNPKSETQTPNLDPRSSILDPAREKNGFKRPADPALRLPLSAQLPAPCASRSALRAPRFAVLTFDDGYLDFYTHAFPILRQYGFPATVFLPTDYIDGSKTGLRGKKHLTRDLVQELFESGIDFGSHTCTHPQLHELSPDEIELEVRKSKETIEQILNSKSETQNGNQPVGYPDQLASSSILKKESINQPITQLPNQPVLVSNFCYPYKFPEGDGPFVKSIERVLRDSGYTSCATTRIGTENDTGDLYSLKRIPVNSADDEILFLSKLTGGYNWLYFFQVFRKSLMATKKEVAAKTIFLFNQSPNQLKNH